MEILTLQPNGLIILCLKDKDTLRLIAKCFNYDFLELILINSLMQLLWQPEVKVTYQRPEVLRLERPETLYK